MKISILTVAPETMEGFLSSHCVQRAQQLGLGEVQVVDIRDFIKGSFRDIDDSPYGGGKGMILRCDAVLKALSAVKKKTETEGAADETDESKDSVYTVALAPAGKPFDQKKAHEFSEKKHLVLICGHYEGIDERVYSRVDEEVSMGDFILTGGEIPAMAIADAVLRLLPGNLKEGSAEEESFENGLLEYPQYTHPVEYEGMKVPDVLLSGDHKAIERWRQEQAIQKTAERRPDLYQKWKSEGGSK